jgi:hypothetical protein
VRMTKIEDSCGCVYSNLGAGRATHSARPPPRHRCGSVSACPRFVVDHQAHVGGQAIGVADAELLQCAFQQLNHAIGHVVLYAQHAQRPTLSANKI